MAADLGLQSRVRFLGDRRDIPAVLASLDVSVVPSASESLSNVMLESMAAGVPVVATAVGGNIELGGAGRALLVAPNDVEALAAGLERLLEDRRFARKCRTGPASSPKRISVWNEFGINIAIFTARCSPEFARQRYRESPRQSPPASSHSCRLCCAQFALCWGTVGAG